MAVFVNLLYVKMLNKTFFFFFIPVLCPGTDPAILPIREEDHLSCIYRPAVYRPCLGQQNGCQCCQNAYTSNEGHGTLRHIPPTGCHEVRHYSFLCLIPVVATLIYIDYLAASSSQSSAGPRNVAVESTTVGSRHRRHSAVIETAQYFKPCQHTRTCEL